MKELNHESKDGSESEKSLMVLHNQNSTTVLSSDFILSQQLFLPVSFNYSRFYIYIFCFALFWSNLLFDFLTHRLAFTSAACFQFRFQTFLNYHR